MAELFQRDKSVISRHVKNVFEDGELTREATVAEFATVQREGAREVTRQVEYSRGALRDGKKKPKPKAKGKK